MTSSNATILSVGAAGKFARLVVPELAKRGVTVRGLIRHADDAERIRKHGAAEAILDCNLEYSLLPPTSFEQLVAGPKAGQ